MEVYSRRHVACHSSSVSRNCEDVVRVKSRDKWRTSADALTAKKKGKGKQEACSRELMDEVQEEQ